MYIPTIIIVIVAIALIVYLFIKNESKKEDFSHFWMQELIDSGYIYNFEDFRKENKQYNEYQALKSFLTLHNKELIRKAADSRRAARDEYAEQQRKEFLEWQQNKLNN